MRPVLILHLDFIDTEYQEGQWLVNTSPRISS